MIFFNTLTFCGVVALSVAGFHPIRRFAASIDRSVFLVPLSLWWAHAFLKLPYGALAAFVVVCVGFFALLTSFEKRTDRRAYALVAVVAALWMLLRFPAVSPLLQTHEMALAFVGTSYAFCRLLSVFFDYRAGVIERLEFGPFLSYMTYFPAWLSGPITRYSHFAVEDNESPYVSTYLVPGFKRIVIGIIKRNIVVELLSTMLHGSEVSLWAYAYLYAAYLYTDFSGYTDLAIGFSKLLRINIPENFNLPFLARNPQDFWWRWHISLTEWLNTYIFNPTYVFLLKRRSDAKRTTLAAISILITFLFAGIWHGQGWRFLVYGAYHGIGLGLYRIFDDWMKRRHGALRVRLRENRWFTWASIVLTAHYVLLGFLIFSGRVGIP